ncbi:MAG: HEAT repeat domain-containing protein [Bacteroidetes bacterium]|nr:HEAT repeat domain-containing protein [Bacteroidota bacterium]
MSFLSKEYRSGSEEAGVVMDALKDPFWKIRLTALDNISELAKNIPDSVLPVVRKLANTDSSSDVREAAYRTLGKYFRYQDLVEDFENGLKDSSYQVNARVFKIVSEKDAIKATQIAKNMEADSSSDIFYEITNYYSLHPEENHVSYFSRAIGKSKGWNRYQVINNFGKYLAQTEENVMIEGLPVLEYFGTQLEKRHLKNAINNCYKAIQTELKSKIEKKGRKQSTTLFFVYERMDIVVWYRRICSPTPLCCVQFSDSDLIIYPWKPLLEFKNWNSCRAYLHVLILSHVLCA